MGLAAVLLLLAASALGADRESQLPAGTSEQVRASVREAIRAGVDPDEIGALTAKMAENRFSEQLTVRAHEIVMTARRERLPVEPIVNKAYEGIAKRVAAEKTVQAMETVRSRYATAFQTARFIAADEKQQQALGRTIAEGLAAGIQERDMTRMTERVQQQDRKMNREQKSELALQSFQTAREMARLGVSSVAVADVVCQALQHQFTAREMSQVRNVFTAEARYGKAETIAQQYGAQIGGGMRAGGLGAAGGAGGGGSAGAGSGSGAGGGGGSGSGSGGGAGGSGGSGGGSGGGGCN
jgi:hypothetical protein